MILVFHKILYTQSDAAPCIDIFGVAKCADEVGDGLLHADPAGLVEPLARRYAELDLWIISLVKCAGM